MLDFDFKQLKELTKLNINTFLDLLKKESLNYIEPISYIEDKNYSMVFFKKSFILFKGKKQNIYFYDEFISNDFLDNIIKQEDYLYVNCNYEEDFENVLLFIKTFFENGYEFFLLKGDKFKDYLDGKITAKVRNIVYSTKPTSNTNLVLTLNNELKIKELTLDNLDFILENYSSDRDYIISRINDGMLGAFYNGTLVGFIGNHNDGSMGLLFIKEDFRKMKIGSNLEKAMIKKLQSDGKPVFGQIEIDNEISMEVHRKANFLINSEVLYWFY